MIFCILGAKGEGVARSPSSTPSNQQYSPPNPNAVQHYQTKNSSVSMNISRITTTIQRDVYCKGYCKGISKRFKGVLRASYSKVIPKVVFKE